MKEFLKIKTNARSMAILDPAAAAKATIKGSSREETLAQLSKEKKLVSVRTNARPPGPVLAFFIDEDLPANLSEGAKNIVEVEGWELPGGKLVAAAEEDIVRDNGAVRFERMRSLKSIKLESGTYQAKILAGPELLERREEEVKKRLTSREALIEKLINLALAMMLIAGALSLLAAAIAMVFFVLYGNFPSILWLPGPFFALGLIISWIGTDFKDFKAAEKKRRDAAEDFPDVAVSLKKTG